MTAPVRLGSLFTGYGGLDTDPATWDDGVGADDIHDWAMHSDHDAAARYLERRQRAEAVEP